MPTQHTKLKKGKSPFKIYPLVDSHDVGGRGGDVHLFLITTPTPYTRVGVRVKSKLPTPPSTHNSNYKSCTRSKINK